MNDRFRLTRISLSGYKSIDKNGQCIDLGDVTVLIGANGAGKSNLVSFFRMLNYMMTGSLQTNVAQQGYANSILHYGAQVTSRLEAQLEFTDSSHKDAYRCVLSHAAGDTLIYNEEQITWQSDIGRNPLTITLDPGGKESDLLNRIKKPTAKTEKMLFRLLRGCQVFQFHDTSQTARVRNAGYIEDNEFFRSDGGNVAAILYRLKNKYPAYYDRIISFVQSAIPQFKSFELYPSSLNDKMILLNWRDNKSDYLFGPHQLSDGSLRFICLATLFLMPPDMLPDMIVLDEPELGLHPSAIGTMAGMVNIASIHCQVMMATQSPRIIDEFVADNIVVVNMDERSGSSTYRRLKHEELDDWLERYSMSELWEKNVLGGKP